MPDTRDYGSGARSEGAGSIGAFEFKSTGRILFGWGSVDRLGDVCKEFGTNVLVVCGRGLLSDDRRSSGIKRAIESLERAGIDVHLFDQVEPEPSLSTVDKARKAIHERKCRAVVGFGGGSAMDVAKAAAGLALLDGPTSDFFYGRRKIADPGLPWVGVPTTAGTGAEVTPNAVLTDRETGVKQSIRSSHWLSRAAVVDPELTVTAPPKVTAYTGMDAFVQALEAYTSKNATILTDSLSLQAVALTGNNILKAYRNGLDRAAREAMALGSLMAALAFVNCRLGAVHGLAHPVGSLYNIPHGLVCAVLIPYIVELNWDVASEKYRRAAQVLGADDLPGYLKTLNRELGIPEKLGELGLVKSDFDRIVEESMPSGSLKANPKQVRESDLYSILERNLV